MTFSSSSVENNTGRRESQNRRSTISRVSHVPSKNNLTDVVFRTEPTRKSQLPRLKILIDRQSFCSLAWVRGDLPRTEPRYPIGISPAALQRPRVVSESSRGQWHHHNPSDNSAREKEKIKPLFRKYSYPEVKEGLTSDESSPHRARRLEQLRSGPARDPRPAS